MQRSASRNLLAPVSSWRHFYQFYRGREDFFHVVIPFLRLGLENREACLWVVSRSLGITEAIEAFQRRCDLTPYIENGQLLILPAERWYLDRGRFSERKALEKMRKFIEDKSRQGFAAFRGTGDLGWLDLKDWTQFQVYEKRIQDWIQTPRVTALCTYPIERFSLILTQEVVDHHDGVFLTKL